MNPVIENGDYFEKLGELVEAAPLGVHSCENDIPKKCNTCKYRETIRGYCKHEGSAYNCVDYSQWELDPLAIKIKTVALEQGFSLLEQLTGEVDIDPRLYNLARRLFEMGRQAKRKSIVPVKLTDKNIEQAYEKVMKQELRPHDKNGVFKVVREVEIMVHAANGLKEAKTEIVETQPVP